MVIIYRGKHSFGSLNLKRGRYIDGLIPYVLPYYALLNAAWYDLLDSYSALLLCLRSGYDSKGSALLLVGRRNNHSRDTPEHLGNPDIA